MCVRGTVIFLLHSQNIKMFPAPLSEETYNDVVEFIKDLQLSRGTFSTLELWNKKNQHLHRETAP